MSAYRVMRWTVERHQGDAGYRWVRESVLDGGPGRRLVVIGKNPSTADRRKPDPTSGAVERFAAEKGFGRVCLVNLFALRSADARHLETRAGLDVPLDEAIGLGNDEVLIRETERADVVAAAWGKLSSGMRLRDRYDGRIRAVLDLLADRPLHAARPLGDHCYPLHGYNWGGLHRDLELVPVLHTALRPPAPTRRAGRR